MTTNGAPWPNSQETWDAAMAQVCKCGHRLGQHTNTNACSQCKCIWFEKAKETDR